MMNTTYVHTRPISRCQCPETDVSPPFYANITHTLTHPIIKYIWHGTLMPQSSCFQCQITKSMSVNVENKSTGGVLSPTCVTWVLEFHKRTYPVYSILFMHCHTYVKTTVRPSNSPSHALSLALISTRHSQSKEEMFLLSGK